MGYYVAAERPERPTPQGFGGGKRRAQTDEGPGGTCHAVAEGAERVTETVCGIPLTGLVEFPKHPWGRGGRIAWCPKCEREAPLNAG